jgi:sulfatase maturation enzyme AslB (radical SAM superfamily)
MVGLHLFPFASVKPSSKIIIYCAGIVGDEYIRQVKATDYCEILFVSDRNYKDIRRLNGIDVYSPEKIRDAQYDHIVIANGLKEAASEIAERLHELGVEADKVVYVNKITWVEEDSLRHSVSSGFIDENGKFPQFRLFKTKKIIIWGEGRAVLDLLYVFPDLNVEYFISNPDEERAKKLSKPVHEPSVLAHENKDDILVIVCAYNLQTIKAQLENFSLIYREHYVYAEDYTCLLDFPTERPAGDKKIAFWVANIRDNMELYIAFLSCYGYCADIVLAGAPNGVKIICDCHAPSEEPDGAKFDFGNYFIIIAGDENREIENKLTDEKLVINKDFMFWHYSENLPSRLYSKMMYTEPVDIPITRTACNMFEAACSNVFDFLQIDRKGTTSFICCPVFFRPSVGQVDDYQILDAYHSAVAEVQRLSVVNHTYSFCDPHLCRVLIRFREKLSARFRVDHIVNEEDYRKRAAAYPKNLHLSIDETCNLTCKFCRSGLIVLNSEEAKKIDNLANIILSEFVPHIDRISLSGNGEVFFSKIYRKIAYNEMLANRHPRISLDLQSNGQLFTKKNFEPLEPLYKEINLNVSIDAGTKSTYEKKMRHGGSWGKLVENMAYAGELRKEKRIGHFAVSFICTLENYMEMPSFIEWMKSVNADEIIFRALLRTPYMPDEEFERISMLDKNFEIKPEFREFLQNPIFSDPVVHGGNLLGHL